MLIDDPVLITNPYYEKLPKLLASDLHKCFIHMPKPAIHHTHLTACADLNMLNSLTYNDFVYYSEKEDMFFVNKNGCDKEGYLPVNVLRQYSQNAHEFDAKLMANMRCPNFDPEDHNIWSKFQHKFMLTFQLYNYEHFF